MIYNFIPAVIMFVITVVFVTALCVPITSFQRKDKLTNFYWVGTWVFLVMIAATAGAQNTLMILGYDANSVSNGILSGITVSFVCFIVFAWFRLSGAVIVGATRRLVEIRNDR